MSLVHGTPNPYAVAFRGGFAILLGILYDGMSPMVAGYLAGIGTVFRKEIIVTLTYNSGRITACAPVGDAINILTCGGSDVADVNYGDISIRRKRWRWNF
jgi:hypothetical protein